MIQICWIILTIKVNILLFLSSNKLEFLPFQRGKSKEDFGIVLFCNEYQIIAIYKFKK